jgi:uncharacterized membrane protein YhdT
MPVLLIWAFLAVIVAIAAESRGRSSLAWFFVACIISPLIALILLMVMSNLRYELQLQKLAERPTSHPKAGWGARNSRVTIERDPTFEPEGIYAGIPYRVVPGGQIEAIMQGRVVRFSSFEKFMELIGPAIA